MKIAHTGLTGSSPAEAGKTQETQRLNRTSQSRTGSGREAGAHDRVEVSSLAGLMAHTLTSSAVAHSTRVAKLNNQYHGGTYQVNSMAVSRALVDESLAVGKTP